MAGFFVRIYLQGHYTKLSMSEEFDGSTPRLTAEGSDKKGTDAALLAAGGDRNGSQGEPDVTDQEMRLYWFSCSTGEDEFNEPGPAFKDWYARVLQQGFVQK